MLTSSILFEKLKEFEGCRLESYQDAAGIWTIGYGHTHNIRRGEVISPYWAEEYLHRDIAQAEKLVLRLGVCRTQGELDALVSFVFNLGIRRLEGSTLLKVIRAGRDSEAIRREFCKWVYATDAKTGRKVVLKGLVVRRTWEAERFFAATPALAGNNDHE